MDLTPDAVRTLRSTLRKDFEAAYGAAPIFYNDIATTVPSSGPSNVYAWATQMPGLRKWVGPRVVQNLASSAYTLVNETWEMTLGVKREDFEDDNLGIYSMNAAGLGSGAAKHPDEQMVSLLQSGHLNECYDGQFFFDTDHPVNPKDAAAGTYANYATGTALTRATFNTVRVAMMGFKGEKGRHLGVRPNLLVVPPALHMTAIEILQNEIVKDVGSATGISNPTRGLANILVVDELAGQDTTWYLLATNKPIKPFVYQLRRPLYMTTKAAQDDHVVLEENMVKFYWDGRDTAGYSLPFLAYKAVA